MAKNETAKAVIYLDGKQAEAALEGLKTKATNLREALKKAADAGDDIQLNKIKKELSGVESAISGVKKETYDYEKVLKNINGASLNELKKSLRTVELQMGKMSRTDPGYEKARASAMRFRNEINSINSTMRAQQPFFSRFADGFNRYFGVATAWAAGIAGISMTIKGAIQSFNDYEERVAALSSLTGLAGDDLKYLSDQAKELSTSTLEGGVLVTNGSQDIIDAFTKVGSARPELLKNKEALVEVTKNAMILSSASKEELGPSISALTMVMNQYNASAEDARRIINTLAAGSKEGAGEIPYITTAFEKAGTVASDAGISIETLTATIETLAPRISQAEVAGTQLRGVLLRMQKGADDTNPAIVGMSKALENLKNKNLSTTEMIKMFGMENVSTAKILVNNVEELKKYELAVTGTNTALEQGAVNTNTNNARLAQAKERFMQLARTLGEKLSPAYGSIISKSSLMLKSIVSLVDFVIKYGRAITSAGAAIAGYVVYLKVATLAESLYGSMKTALTGKITLATIAQKAWNLALKSNPIGLIVGLIAGAVTWLVQWDKKTGKVSAALKILGGYMIDLANYFIDLYNSSLPIRVAVQYIVGIWKTGFEGVKLVMKGLWEELKLGGKLLKAVFTFDFKGIKEALADFANNNKKNVVESAKNVADTWSDAYNNAMKGKLNHIGKKSTITVGVPAEESSGGPLSTSETSGSSGGGGGGDLEDEDIGDEDSDTGSGKGKGKKTKALTEDQMIEQSLKSLDEYYQKRLGDIEEQHLKEQDSEASFQIKKKVAEKQFLQDKKQLLQDFGRSTTEVDSKLMEEELNALKEREEALKDTAEFASGLNEKLLEEFSEKLRTEEELEQERLNKSVEENIEYGEMLREQMARTEDEKLALLKEKLDAGKITQKEYEDAVTKIHNDAEEERKRKTEQRFQVAQELTNSAVNLVNSMMELELQKAGDNEEKKNEIRKKYAGIQFTSAVAQIVVDTAGAIMKAYQQLGPIAGSVAAALLAATGVVQIQIAKAQRNQVLGYASGGYTGDGDTYEPAGVVHRGEWVAPKSMVRDNRYSGVISFLESQRRAGNFSRVNVPAISGSNARGYATGGPVTSVPNVPGISAQNNEDTNAKLVQAIDKLLSWKPTVHTELIKRDLDTLENINRNRNM